MYAVCQRYGLKLLTYGSLVSSGYYPGIGLSTNRHVAVRRLLVTKVAQQDCTRPLLNG